MFIGFKDLLEDTLREMAFQLLPCIAKFEHSFHFF